MIGRLVLPLLIIVTLSLSGCIVGDGVAHLVKMTQDSQKKSAAAPAAAESPEAAAPAPRDVAPPPPPAAAPSRSAVSVETLAPPAP